MSVSIYVEVSGRTYDVKEKLKSLGLRWDGDQGKLRKASMVNGIVDAKEVLS